MDASIGGITNSYERIITLEEEVWLLWEELKLLSLSKKTEETKEIKPIEETKTLRKPTRRGWGKKGVFRGKWSVGRS